MIIRRQYISPSSNDIGFVRGADGNYRAIVSEFDSHRYDSAWLDRVKQAYAKNVVVKEAKRSGLHIVSTDRQGDGSIRMVLEV